MIDAICSLPRRAFVASAIAMASISPAKATWMPRQPIRILIGYPPGGAVDILVRLVADGMQRTRGVSVVPEVKSGAYGLVAAQTAARAAPDGYTLASAIMGMMCVLPVIPGVPIPIDLDRELTPVSALAGTPMALVARPDAPFSDVDGLIAYARSRQGSATYASAGNGSINHLAAALFAGEAGISMTHVSYRGGAPAALDVSAGRVDIMVANVAEVAPMIRAGQLKGLGVTSATPSVMLPDLPMLALRFPLMEINNWFGIAGPAGLPDDVRDGLADLFATALRDPQTARALTERGLIPLGESGATFEERIRRDRARWRRVAEAGNIRAD